MLTVTLQSSWGQPDKKHLEGSITVGKIGVFQPSQFGVDGLNFSKTIAIYKTYGVPETKEVQLIHLDLVQIVKLCTELLSLHSAEDIQRAKELIG